MDRAIALARSAFGTTSPNPAVGAVVVKEDVVLGEGHTLPPGSSHAEVVALQQAGAAAAGAALYVSMEPCCIQGRTPPCTKAIVDAGITQVHVATIDPNPRVAGRGLEELKAAGIQVVRGSRENEALDLYEAFAKHINTGIPFVIAKYAASLDGKTATRSGDSRWITGDKARQHVHKMRRGCDAIMVGVNTVLRDNPQLTARQPDGTLYRHQPLRVVLDSKCCTPADAAILAQEGNTLIVVVDPPGENALALQAAGAEILHLPATDSGPAADSEMVDIGRLLGCLGSRGIVSLLSEGGSTVLGTLFRLRLVDKVAAFIAPAIIGGASTPSAVGGIGAEDMSQILRLERSKVEVLGDDVLITGYPPSRISEF